MTVAGPDIGLLVEEDGTGFRVDSRVYTDPSIFDAEMRRIFERLWVCVAHESRLGQGGDYVTTSVGRQPVIVTRDRDAGRIHVLFNRCRHRGATVCQEECGTTRFFRCGYHGWTYGLDGALTGVPLRTPSYEGSFDRLGLVAAPRVETRHGFVFASLAGDGGTLDEQLGNAAEYLETFSRFGGADVVPVEVTAGVSKLSYPGNWKLQLENTVDTYHPEFVHHSQGKVIERRRGKAAARNGERQAELRTWDLGNGHGAFDLAPGGPRAGVTGKFFQGPAFHISIFPNLCLLPTQIRIIRPLAVDRTVVDAYPVMVADMPAEAVERRLRAYEEFYGPAGFGAPDDIEMFDRVQAGVQADLDLDGLRWIDMSRGLGYEELDDRGRRSSRWSDESPQRAIYRGWQQALNGQR